jgi:hypothetical protein
MKMKNWKTTLFGGLTAAGLGLSQSDDPILKTIGQILMVVAPVLLGIFAKDSNVTGGMVQQ